MIKDLKKVNNILLSLFVVVNLSVSFDYLLVGESTIDSAQIELIESMSVDDFAVVGHHQISYFQNFNALEIKLPGSIGIDQYLAKNYNAQESLKFKTQQIIFVAHRPLQLQIKINDILTQQAAISLM